MRIARKIIVGLCFIATVLQGRASYAQDKIRLQNLTERCVLSLYSVETKSWQEPILLEKSADVEIVLKGKQNYCGRIYFSNNYHRDVLLGFHKVITETKYPAHEIPKFVLQTINSERVIPITHSYYKKIPNQVVRDGAIIAENQLIWQTDYSTEIEAVKYCYVSLLHKNIYWVIDSPQPILLGLPEPDHDAIKLLK